MAIQNSQSKALNIARPRDVISKAHPSRLFILLLAVFIVFALLSAVYLYLDVYMPLNIQYGSIVSALSEIHETLVARTVKINIIFFILTCAGILIIGIVYTHRICGPLHRIQMFAKLVSEGKLDNEIIFRKKDAIHLFGDAFNEMTKNYSDRLHMFSSEVRSLKESIQELKSLSEEGKDDAAGFDQIIETDRKIKKLLSTIKL